MSDEPTSPAEENVAPGSGEKPQRPSLLRKLLRTGQSASGAMVRVLYREFHSRDEHARHQWLGNALIEAENLTDEQLTHALEHQRRSGRLLADILVEHEFVSRAALCRILARRHGLDYADSDKMPSDVRALRTVPRARARHYQFVPVDLEGDKLTVLINSPEHAAKLEDVGILLEKRIHPVLSPIPDIRAEIDKRYLAAGVTGGEEELPEELRKHKRIAIRSDSEGSAPRRKKLSGEPASLETGEAAPPPDASPFAGLVQRVRGASAVEVVSTLIEGAIARGATDIHLDPQNPEMRVRYRIDGILHDVMTIPAAVELAVVSRIKVIADLDITETRRPQDGHISLEFAEHEFDVRVATLPTFLGERVVLRLLDQSSILAGIGDLGLDPGDEKKLVRAIEQPYGMILVTGPTGSGKTTTLYAALCRKNVTTDSIVTLEDPVEYQLPGINQVPIEPEIGMTFAHVLRASLRQDIDVLLVGEIRDKETAHIGIRAAMTGHLVFSTLHTNDAPEAIGTLRNLDCPNYLISSALTCVVGQRLVRTMCDQCKAAFRPSQALLKTLQMPLTTKRLFRGAGCPACYNTGNAGRTGIFEILEVTAEVRQAIYDERNGPAIAEIAKMVPMSVHCRAKVKEGIITPEEFLRVIRL